MLSHIIWITFVWPVQHVHGTCMCFNVHQTVYLYGWTVRAGQIGRTADGRHVCHLAASHDTSWVSQSLSAHLDDSRDISAQSRGCAGRVTTQVTRLQDLLITYHTRRLSSSRRRRNVPSLCVQGCRFRVEPGEGLVSAAVNHICTGLHALWIIHETVQ